ncbi:MAG: NADH-quinone oxidoreductase subunit L, partial [bacterium]|nr:NADH-quinone oxidoreductase subunit L [bacterium]
MQLSLIILLPLLGALINGAFALGGSIAKRQVPRALVNLFGVGLPFAAFALALNLGIPFIEGKGAAFGESMGTWVLTGSFQVDFGLYWDRLAVLMTLIVTGVGSLIHLYSTGYMKEDPAYAKYFAYLNLFLTAMLLLVLGDNLLMMFLGWEGVGLCSYLLIGFWFEDPAKAYAGKKAFVVNRIGDFGFLIGIFMVGALLLPAVEGSASVLNFGFMQEHSQLLAGSATAIALFLFIGAMGKSAQIPLYVWLPDAMAGPTPVSALIHAATMVTAGIYLVARLFFLFEMTPAVLQFIAVIGGATALFAATIAIVQNDIKKVLAYSTISQLGYMFLAMGVGSYSTGLFHLMTHAFFKACLFLGAGSVIHALHHEQDIRRMGGLRKYLPVTAWTFVVATLAISGIFPFAGFFSKDEIVWEVFHRGHSVLGSMALGTAVLTSFYMWRLTFLTFFGASRLEESAKAHAHESPWNMTSVLVILAALSAVGGLVGVPHILGGHHWLRNWLGLGQQLPQDAQADRLELTLMVASVSLALLSAGFAYLLYVKNTQWPRIWAKKFHGIYRLLLNKYYVDEIYDATVVGP